MLSYLILWLEIFSDLAIFVTVSKSFFPNPPGALQVPPYLLVSSILQRNLCLPVRGVYLSRERVPVHAGLSLQPTFPFPDVRDQRIVPTRHPEEIQKGGFEFHIATLFYLAEKMLRKICWTILSKVP